MTCCLRWRTHCSKGQAFLQAAPPLRPPSRFISSTQCSIPPAQPGACCSYVCYRKRLGTLANDFSIRFILAAGGDCQHRRKKSKSMSGSKEAHRVGSNHTYRCVDLPTGRYVQRCEKAWCFSGFGYARGLSVKTARRKTWQRRRSLKC